MKIQSFDKPLVREIKKSVESLLHQLETDYGIAVTLGNNTMYSSNEVTYKVTLSTLTPDGNANTKEARDWDAMKSSLGLAHLSVGDTITLSGKQLILKGYNSRAPKSPVILEGLQGQMYKCAPGMLKKFII